MAASHWFLTIGVYGLVPLDERDSFIIIFGGGGRDEGYGYGMDTVWTRYGYGMGTVQRRGGGNTTGMQFPFIICS